MRAEEARLVVVVVIVVGEGKGAVLSFTRFGRVVGEVEVSEGFLKDLKKVL